MGLDLIARGIVQRCEELFADLDSLDEQERIDCINAIRFMLHSHSPLKDQPVDCVLWVKADTVEANAYNPNTVAAPEMRLLRKSIEADGYTQPIVTFSEDGRHEVVDGFHRNRVGKETPKIRKRVKGRLPIVLINQERQGKADRIAATIRHNRARGKHGVEAMSEIVMELHRRNWTDEKIGKELGMDADEVLRLKQITGLAEMFADREFSEAWEA